MLTAREFNRGTMQMLDGLRPYERLGMRIPKVQIVINCLDQTNDPGRFTRMCVPSSMSIRIFLYSKRLSRMPSCFAMQHRAGYQRTASKRGNPRIAHQRPRWKSSVTWPSRSFPSGLTASSR